MPWQDSWSNKNYDKTGSNIQDAWDYTDLAGDAYGAITGGDRNPITSLGKDIIGGGTSHNANQINWQPGDEDVYKQMDQQQWSELSRKQTHYQREWIDTRKRWLAQGHDDKGNPVKPGTFWNPQTGKSEPTAPPGGANSDGLNDAIQEYYKHMMAPLDQNDPEVKRVIAMGTNTAQRQYSNTGIRGGLSDAGVTKAALDSAGGLQQFRQGQGLQALSLANNRQQGLANIQMQQYGIQRDNSLAAYNSQTAQRQALLGTVGGIAGGYFGGPTGAAAGSQLGAGLANQGNNYVPPTYDPNKNQGGY